MATLNTVFKKTFEALLAGKGYRKVKGRQPYFARMAGGEIVQVITVRNYWCGEREYKEFEILGGMASVYQKEVDLTRTPSNNISWMECLPTYYDKMNQENYDREYRNSLRGFRYQKDNEASLYQAMAQALEKTEIHMLGVFDKVNNLSAYMEYLNIFDGPRLLIEKYNEEEGGFWEKEENEGFLYILTDNHSDFKEEYEEMYSRSIRNLDVESASEKMRIMVWEKRINEECRMNELQKRDYIYTHPEVYKKVMKILEERKNQNIERLRSCGLDAGLR